MVVKANKGPTVGPSGPLDMIARQGAVAAKATAASAVAMQTIGGTVAALPAPGDVPIGTRRYVTDALLPTFLAVVADGGSAFTPVISDGTDWLVG